MIGSGTPEDKSIMFEVMWKKSYYDNIFILKVILLNKYNIDVTDDKSHRLSGSVNYIPLAKFS